MGIPKQLKSIRGTKGARPNVLVLRSGGLGDFILMLPVLDAIRQACPGAMIELVGKPEIGELGLDRYYLDRVTSIDQARLAKLFGDEPLQSSDPVAAYLSVFDLAISFLGTDASSLADKLGSQIHRAIFIPQPSPGAGHACTQFLAHLDRGVPELAVTEPLPPRVVLTEADRRQGQELLRRAVQSPKPDQVIVIHPGSGSPRKNWSPRHFAAVASWFQDNGFQAILLQGEADEASIGQVLAATPSRAFSVLRDLRVIEAAQVLSACRLLIGNDSGISHLAAATGIPVIALFGASDPAMWRPLGPRVTVLTWDEATPQLVAKEAQALL